MSAQDADRRARVRASLGRVMREAHACLLSGGALEAVTQAVRLLEDDELFNAGTGSQLQADGRARLSASVMDGVVRRFAGVVNLERIKNPVLVARRLLDREHRVLAGEGALAFALSEGFREEDTRTPESIRRWKWKGREAKASDTVGACALDAEGRLAGATSTGGIGLEMPGRVSDSCTPAGNYASGVCAVSATGVGEEILDECLAATVAVRVEEGLPIAEAFARAFAGVRIRGRRMGAIGVDRDGRLAWDTTSGFLAYGWKKGDEEGFWDCHGDLSQKT